ncbi:LOW QUALITY PROTEIN: receptor-like protein 9DC3 [Mercurialis annua]|uniref:LOW QUALITY PROTEIN: receptor-like protein 9DC3 n=1 Tax=Mercurialis annua TaxID=3986 RepID=UPI0021605DA5|nr:LOW QUALITY PROTEIN: receptor-like protein 9DC3 [Mercurialis annua]
MKMGNSVWFVQFLCLYLFYFTNSQSLNSNSSSSSPPLCRHDQSLALLQFRRSLSILNSPTNTDIKSWKEGTDCCSWDGITCNTRTGNVVGLRLYGSSLYGTIHSDSSLFLLRHLQQLDLSWNDFNKSHISPQFGKFFDLTELRLSFSNFAGQIPPEISQLSSLVSLDLYGNDLSIESTSFSEVFQNLTKLQDLDLSFTDLSLVSSSSLMNLSSSLSNLNLRFCNLHGNFPDISHLSALQSLDVSLNLNLTMEEMIFNKLARNLTKLTYVDLSRVDMSLVASSSFANLSSSLSSLSLSHCKLQGNILLHFIHLSRLLLLNLSWNSNLPLEPSTFEKLARNLTELTELDLSYTNMSLIAPSYLLNLSSSVSTFKLASCELRGKFPDNILQLQNLQWLDLWGNQELTGSLPRRNWGGSLILLSLSRTRFPIYLEHDVFNNLTSLSILELSACKFVGSLPDVALLGQILQLTRLDLSHNDFRGPIPSVIGNLEQLSELDLSYNSFSGRVPSSLFMLPNLSYLVLSNNLLTGHIGEFNSTSVYYIDLSNNRMNGSLPSSFYQLANLNVFIVSSNKELTGQVSLAICNLKSLQILDLSNNNFSGLIPECLGNSLSVLHLSNNNFQGAIKFSNCSNLRYLNFNRNLLKGRISQSITNCNNLEILDLGNNEIDDTFPYFLGSLLALQILVLKSNKLHGSVITSSNATSSFRNVRIFDLSNNMFSGPLPEDFFANFKAIMVFEKNTEYMRAPDYSYDYYVKLTIKGLEIELVKIQTLLTTIDLSSNKFEGKIPQSIDMLISLKQLNLSHNGFTGNIQPSLRKLVNLESLDLSSNLFTGRIPTELTDLIFLQVFRVSYNQLEGPIPHGKQFNTFDKSSYEGNSRLCGFPLEKECEINGNGRPQPSNEDDSGSEENNGDGWKPVLSGYGCGLVFGIATGCIVFKTRKRSWFVKMIEAEGYLLRNKFDKHNGQSYRRRRRRRSRIVSAS